MLDSKFFFTLVGLIVAVFAICNTNISPNISENFWGHYPFQTRVIQQVKHSNGTGNVVKGSNYLLGGGNNNNLVGTSNRFFQTPHFQSNLSPRINPTPYGAYIKYNLPDNKNLALDPRDPLSMGNVVKENYDLDRSTKCDSDSSLPKTSPFGGEDSNYINAMNNMYDENQSPVSSLAIGDMTSVGADGLPQQSVIYNNFYVASKKSRLLSQADHVRGDLAIQPSSLQYFRPSSNPATDLSTGYLAAAGGYDMENLKALTNLKYSMSGGTDTTMSGVDLTQSYIPSLTDGIGDVSVTSFP